jgi:hypothetical protein
MNFDYPCPQINSVQIRQSTPMTKSYAKAWRTSESLSEGVRFIDYSETHNSKE